MLHVISLTTKSFVTFQLCAIPSSTGEANNGFLISTMSIVDKGNLVWTVAATKEMFQEYRLWPSFVGTNFDQERRASKGRLPAMLWPEQRR